MKFIGTRRDMNIYGHRYDSDNRRCSKCKMPEVEFFHLARSDDSRAWCRGFEFTPLVYEYVVGEFIPENEQVLMGLASGKPKLF